MTSIANHGLRRSICTFLQITRTMTGLWELTSELSSFGWVNTRRFDPTRQRSCNANRDFSLALSDFDCPRIPLSSCM
jgi:hypothetical protein